MALAPNDPTVPAEQSKMLLRMLAVFAVASVGLSFLEADRRGLLFDADPFAFSVSEGALALTGPSVIRFGNARRGGAGPRYRSFGRGPARRLIPGQGSGTDQPGTVSPGSGPPAGALASNTGSSFPSPLTNTRPAPFVPGQSTANFPLAPTSGQSIPGSGFAPSPIGFVAGGTDPSAPPPSPPVTVDPDPGPVVPAIPEPASWLLMIIGLGWMGLYLRRQHPRLARCA